MLRRFQSVGKCGEANLIDLFMVSVAIFEGKHGKIYNKCMVKVGILMLYNLRKVDILKFLWFTN